jgi:MinD-like ATPase involved in chromosome partitioning or flagellar assembly
VDVQVVLGVTAHEWGSRLADWIADHSENVTVRDRYALEESDVLSLEYDCLVLDHQASMLTAQLVARVHRDGRAIVGVDDPSQPSTRERLERLGVDATVPIDAEPRLFVERILSVVRARPRPEFEDVIADLDAELSGDDAQSDGGSRYDGELQAPVIVVSGASEGVGATELAIELAVAMRRRGRSVVLVDADLVAPSLAQRLFVSPSDIRTGNLLTAIDAVHRGSGSLNACVTETTAGCGLICGLEQPGAWETVAPVEVAGVVAELSTRFTYTIVQTAAPIEDLPSGRHAVARRMLQVADRVLVVADANPVGLQRLTRWMWYASTLLEPSAVHVVCNHSHQETRADIEREVLRTLAHSSISHLPADGRVRNAAWALELVATGPYTRAVATLLDERFPETRPERRRRLARLRRAS